MPPRSPQAIDVKLTSSQVVMLDLVHVVPDLGKVVRPVKVALYSRLLDSGGRGLWWRHVPDLQKAAMFGTKPARADLKPGLPY